MTIVVVVPVLNRPQRVAPLVESFLAARAVESTLLFVVSPNDIGERGEILAAIRLSPYAAMFVDAFDVEFVPGPGDFARKVNAAFRISKTLYGAGPPEFIFQAADDVRFEPGWDVEALRVAEATGAGVVGTNDQANPLVVAGRHSTHSLIRCSYVDECGGSLDGPGVVFHEGYGHQYVDNELIELAKHRGCYAHALRSVVRHDHPFFAPRRSRADALMDDTYRKGQSTSVADRKLWLQRRRLIGRDETA